MAGRPSRSSAACSSAHVFGPPNERQADGVGVLGDERQRAAVFSGQAGHRA